MNSKFQPNLGQDSLKILKVNKIVMFHGNLVGAYIHNLIMEVSVSGMEPVPSHEECMRRSDTSLLINLITKFCYVGTKLLSTTDDQIP